MRLKRIKQTRRRCPFCYDWYVIKGERRVLVERGEKLHLHFNFMGGSLKPISLQP